MSLYKKYRPQDWSEVIGNEETVSSLIKYTENIDKSPRAFLLHGPTGTGKTTLARIFANSIGCAGVDYKEINFSDMRGIDTVREIIGNSRFKPLQSPYVTYVLDECHKMTNDAQNGLLKILEDTPSHVFFILCTTEKNKLINTIIGRCTEYQLKVLNENEMFRLLKRVVKREGETLDKEVYEQIITAANGHPRNALTILDKVLSVEPESRLEAAKKSELEQTQAFELCKALHSNKSWKEISQILVGLKDQEAEGIRRMVLGYAQAILLKKDDQKAAIIIEQFFEPLYNVGFPGLVFYCYAVVKS